MSADPIFAAVALQAVADPTKLRMHGRSPIPMLYVNEGRAEAAMRASKDGSSLVQQYRPVRVHIVRADEAADRGY